MDIDWKTGVTFSTAADHDEALAAAIGRYIQASASLERALRTAILRLLPVSDNIGLAVINDHSAASNRDVLSRLLALAELPIEDTWRDRLKAALPAVQASQEDRNRIAHHLIMFSNNDELVSTVEKKGQRTAFLVTTESISSWAIEANELAGVFSTVPFADYSTVTLDRQPPTFRFKSPPERRR